MAEDLINIKDTYFPSYLGTNDKLISLLNRASQNLCDWFSEADKNGPLPFDENFNCLMPGEDGDSAEDLFSDIQSLLNNSFNPVHPGSLAHLDPPPLIFSILGDLIAAGLNNNLLAYELSPSITLLEESLCKWFAKKIGFNDFSGGIAASGGTLSNLNALIAARNNAGLGTNPNSVLLVSEDAHSSFIKCIRIMGLDEANLIRIKTDNKVRIDMQNLRETVDKCFIDKKKIFAIVATLGTTVRGAIDPIKEISEICKGPENISYLFLLILFIKKSFLFSDDFRISSIPFIPKKRKPSHSLITSAGLEPCMPISPLFMTSSLDDKYGSPVENVFSKVLISETNNKDDVFVMPIIF